MLRLVAGDQAAAVMWPTSFFLRVVDRWRGRPGRCRRCRGRRGTRWSPCRFSARRARRPLKWPFCQSIIQSRPSSKGERARSARTAVSAGTKSMPVMMKPASMRARLRALVPIGRRPWRRARGHQRVPELEGAVGRGPELVAEVAGEAGAGDGELDAGEGGAGEAEGLQGLDRRDAGGAQDGGGGRALEREGGDRFGDLLDVDVEADGAVEEPGEVALLAAEQEVRPRRGGRGCRRRAGCRRRRTRRCSGRRRRGASRRCGSSAGRGRRRRRGRRSGTSPSATGRRARPGCGWRCIPSPRRRRRARWCSRPRDPRR